MKKELCAFERQGQDDFYQRTERIAGPEIQGVTPTIQELVQLVKFHIYEFLDWRWCAFTTGCESVAAEDAIWVRLDKIRRVMRDDDFKRTVVQACVLFRSKVDAAIWDALMYGDEAVLQAMLFEIQKAGSVCSSGFSAKLLKQIADIARVQQIPREILRRMAGPIGAIQ